MFCSYVGGFDSVSNYTMAKTVEIKTAATGATMCYIL